jgi:hypothetical protein
MSLTRRHLLQLGAAAVSARKLPAMVAPAALPAVVVAPLDTYSNRLASPLALTRESLQAVIDQLKAMPALPYYRYE